jgi:branched-chain amino acid transport system substrate-binding protein
VRSARTRRNAKGHLFVAAATAALVLAACGSSSKGASGTATTAAAGGQATATTSGSSGNLASAPGVTPTSITVGLITSLTGPGASTTINVPKAVQARIDLQNSQGGVDGRKLLLQTKDDTSSTSGNATAAQVFATGSVFGVIAETPFLFGGYRALQKAGIPVTGGGWDGPEWGTQPNTNMFSYGGVNGSVAGTDPNLPQYTTGPAFIKSQGGTNVASFGFGTTPSSSGNAKGFAEASKAAGLTVGLLDTSIPFGTVNATPIALEMKSAGVDSTWMPLTEDTNFAIITAAKQAGVNLKVPVLATGYGQSLLDDSSALAAGNGAYFSLQTAPVEIRSSATLAMQAAFAKYANFTGVPGFDWYQGWLGADLMIQGLEKAGQNPTRQSFMTGLRGVTDYSGGGLLASPADFSLAKFGTAPPTGCYYFAKLQGTAFVPVPADGKPSCGTLIPGSGTS